MYPYCWCSNEYINFNHEFIILENYLINADLKKYGIGVKFLYLSVFKFEKTNYIKFNKIKKTHSYLYIDFYLCNGH